MEQHSNEKNLTHQNIDYKSLYQTEKSNRIALQKQLQIERIKIKKLITGKSKGKICPICLSQQDQKRNRDLFNDPQGFSTKLDLILKKKNDEASSGNSPTLSKSRDQQLNNNNNTTTCPIIQNFAVFGVPEILIPQGNEVRSIEDIQGDILYSTRQSSDIEQQAARFVFPSGMAIRKLVGQKAKDKVIEMMSYCYTNQKSFILSFQSPENRFKKEEYQNNKFLNHLNPEMKLFCVCIGIHDYTWIQPNKAKPLVTSLSLKEQMPSTQSMNEVKISSTNEEKQQQNPSSTKTTSLRTIEGNQLSVAVSQRVFCIMSYYPFFTFFQDIIRNLINIVKMERLTIYKHSIEDIKNTDSLFQLERMKQLYSNVLRELSHKKIQFNRHFELKLINGQRLALITDYNIAKTCFIGEWVFPILNMFTLDTFIDLLTLLILEDRLVFVCDNSHILTYTIYLFANLLVRPFKYAFPVVNIIPNEQDFLNAPFPVVYGMLKKRKYVEQYRLVQKYPNTFVFLSPNKIDIVYQEDRKPILKRKPFGLKTQLTPIFKELKKQRKPQNKNSKYELQVAQYCVLSTSEQKQAAIRVVQKVNQFIENELKSPLPTHEQVRQMIKNLDRTLLPRDKDQHSYLMDQIATQMKKTNKQPFFEKFLDTQMINVYLFQ